MRQEKTRHSREIILRQNGLRSIPKKKSRISCLGILVGGHQEVSIQQVSREQMKKCHPTGHENRGMTFFMGHSLFIRRINSSSRNPHDFSREIGCGKRKSAVYFSFTAASRASWAAFQFSRTFSSATAALAVSRQPASLSTPSMSSKLSSIVSTS